MRCIHHAYHKVQSDIIKHTGHIMYIDLGLVCCGWPVACTLTGASYYKGDNYPCFWCLFNHQKSTQYYLSHSLLWASNCLWWGKKCSLISCQLVPPIRPSLGFQVQFILHHIIPLAPEWMIQSGSGEIQSWVRKVSRGMGIHFKINLKHSAIPHHSTPYCTPEALLPCFWETLLRNAIKAS